MPDPSRRMLAEIAAVFRAESRACADRTADILATFPGLDAAACGADADADADVIRALLAASPLAVAHATLAAFDALPWGRNPVASRISAEDNGLYRVANLMGPEGPLFCPTLRAGFYYQRPDTRYGLHSHAAVETYVIIAGRAHWTAGDTQREMAPGHAVHHSTYLPHACQTGPEGVVALWRWSGDIGIESYRMHHGLDAFGAAAAWQAGPLPVSRPAGLRPSVPPAVPR